MATPQTVHAAPQTGIFNVFRQGWESFKSGAQVAGDTAGGTLSDLGSIIGVSGPGAFFDPSDTGGADCNWSFINSFGGWDTLSKFVNCAALSVSGIVIFAFTFILDGLIFVIDYIVEISVLNFGDLVTQGVRSAWEGSRNVANLFFIFLLLYAAAGYMLKLPSIGGGREYIVRILIVALFINFSFAMTSFVIDVTNVLGATIYNQITRPQGANSDVSLGDVLLESLSVFQGLSGAVPLGAINTSASPEERQQEIEKLREEMNKRYANTNLVSLLLSTGGGMLVVLAAIFAFGAGALLLLVRMVMLIFHLVLSPIALLTSLFPKFDYINEWWEGLINHAVFAPAYLFAMYIALQAVSGGNVLLTNTPTSGATTKFHTLIVVYAVYIGLMLLAVYVAQRLSVVGSKAAGDYLDKGVGYFKGKGSDAVFKNRGLDSARLLAARFGGALERNQTLGAIPVVGSISRGVGSALTSQARRRIEEQTKEFKDSDRSATGLENIANTEGEAGLFGSLAERATKDTRLEGITKAITGPNIRSLAANAALSDRKKEAAPGGVTVSSRIKEAERAVGTRRRNLNPDEYIDQAGKLSKDDLEDLSDEIFSAGYSSDDLGLRQNFYASATSKKLEAVLGNNKLRDDFIKGLVSDYQASQTSAGGAVQLGSTTEDIAAWLGGATKGEGPDKEPLASSQLVEWLRSPAAAQALAKEGYTAPAKGNAGQGGGRQQNPPPQLIT